MELKKELIHKTIDLSMRAGSAIMKVYNSDDVSYKVKKDSSPLTKADLISNEIILKGLSKISPSLPVLSEENSNIDFIERSKWKRFWLVDPLDGTKEFLKRNGEFTVNIALIENGIPIFGVIHLPAYSKTYWGGKSIGAMSKKDGEKSKKISVSKRKNIGLKVVSSRSHKNDKLDSYLNNFDSVQNINIGSSLKFCLLAEGKADFYPRLGPTSEWDTAAGEAILKYSGGYLLTIEGLKMKYNKSESLLNPYFIAASEKSSIQEFLKHYQELVSS